MTLHFMLVLIDYVDALYQHQTSFFLKYFRYSYDPFTQSLNEFPEAEISVTAGDYVLVWGEADEDGYYEGNGQIFTNSVHIRFVTKQESPSS